MNANEPANGSAPGELCLSCGLCCNGVIFADVKLRRGDNAARLQELGLAFNSPAPGGTTSKRRTQIFTQPCVAHDGCRCRIYPERPVYCREFECALLRKVHRGDTTAGAALGAIGNAKKKAEEVRTLLRALGDTEEGAPLARRFRRTSSRFEQIGFDEATADLYGRLTLAVHDLNFVLHEEFYPPPRESGRPVA